MRTIVNAILISDGKVLLARRSAHRRAYPDCWSFPGGHVEKGESTEETLLRELAEEIGVIPVSYRLIGEIIDPAGTNDPATYHICAVEQWNGKPSIQDEEHTELRWFSLGEVEVLPDLALEDYRRLFAELRKKTQPLQPGGQE
jgi:8-oxo-dGTP diphosphatase